MLTERLTLSWRDQWIEKSVLHLLITPLWHPAQWAASAGSDSPPAFSISIFCVCIMWPNASYCSGFPNVICFFSLCFKKDRFKTLFWGTVHNIMSLDGVCYEHSFLLQLKRLRLTYKNGISSCSEIYIILWIVICCLSIKIVHNTVAARQLKHFKDFSLRRSIK